MTLLAKKQGMSTSDFRNYWAGPHAKLALGMEGIAKYVHNRVDKVLWASRGSPSFTVDGIVELYFEDEEAMRGAQASAVGQRYIPADEPNFLMGWTLCVVDTEGEEAQYPSTKVVVPFLLGATGSKERISQVLTRAAGRTVDDGGSTFTLNWTASTSRRDLLWAEPRPPEGFAVFRFSTVAAAHDAFDEGGIYRKTLEAEVQDATAYLMDELTIREATKDYLASWTG